MRKSVLLAIMTLAAIWACAQDLCVASYNMRYLNSDDPMHGNAWEQRYKWAADLLLYEHPHIIGTQELFSSQLADLEKALPGYAWFGRGREDGVDAGEHSAIFYDTERLALISHGDFWLSETPDTPGLGWDAACPRICTWGKFHDLDAERDIIVFNLHLDHVGSIARRESAMLLLSRIDSLANGATVIVTGDFNVDQREEPYAILTSNGLHDAYETAALRLAPNGTFNDFKTDRHTDSRIDHILLSDDWQVANYAIMTNAYWSVSDDGQLQIRLPSDHYPIFAKLKYIAQ